MIISHNLQAMNTNRIVNNNINAFAKSTRKISSGYGINRAVDNPVGLAMSETMRKQIRGLMQGINNTKDGRAFVQIADGAMEEVHAMLQRMNELSLKALNGLCTEEDRMALNAEFDQLRTEIDRINDTTAFNTMPVFDKHETSYYQISGNRQWKDNQLHTISSTENELNIHLPDGYDPKDYTITVPAGTYTTQELIDEIDDALAKMDPPNPGFVFEYTRDGYCNLNFESAEAKPTNIQSVDGGLAYLIYDFKTGGSPASLLGTSPFEPDKDGNPRKLEIVKGQNDELGFYVESADGVKDVFITIPPGEYDRDAMIKEINVQLAKIDNAKGVAAKPYGDYYIQITGGDTANITGLKGNMFKYDFGNTSIFYDNTVYGSCNKYSAEIKGHNHSGKIKIYDSTVNQNNILCFKVNGDDVRTITLPAGEYTTTELIDKINDLLTADGLDAELEAVNNGGSVKLISKIAGAQSKLTFDTSNDIYSNTYKTLFLTIGREPVTETGEKAYIEGSSDLRGEIIFEPDELSLTFWVDNNKYTIGKDILVGKDNAGDNRTDLNSLISRLNDYANNTPGLENGKIAFSATSDGHLKIEAGDGSVKSITVEKNHAYSTLFTTKGLVSVGKLTDSSVTITKEEGRPGFFKPDQASISITAGPCKLPVDIDGSNNQINLYLSNTSAGGKQSITLNLDSGKYSSMVELKNAISQKLNAAGNDYGKYIQVDYEGNEFKFTLTLPDNGDMNMTEGRWRFSSSEGTNSLWSSIFETKEDTIPPAIQYGESAKVTSAYPITDRIELSDQCGNNDLRVEINGISHTLKIKDNIKNRTDLVNALKKAIADSPLKNVLDASLDRDNRLVLSSSDPKATTILLSGGFYKEVICNGVVNSPDLYREIGNCTFNSPVIIGRRDLTKDSIEITKGFNDTLTFDITYPGSSTPLEVSITIPEKKYGNGFELVDVLNNDESIREQIRQQLGKDSSLDVSFSIGGFETNVHNSIDQFALQISVTHKAGEEPDTGTYIIDGVRGNAACFVFYKTASLPSTTYITGTKDISKGITFEPGKNVLTLSANSEPYQYTFDENKFYTADEFIDELNRRFEQGDDNGNSAPLRATLENGAVKIWHKTVGANTITDIGGSAKGTIFFEEEGRDSRNPLILQVGAEQRSTMELPRIRVDSASLSINSITISKEKYAEKAVEHIKSAIHSLSDRRSLYGAMQNRLDHTINNNENVADSVQTSESRLRDTDVSTELIRYTNLNILLQAGSKMIAHSNNSINKLLTLLG